MTAENYHKEEALGKAYDSRLMKRLLTYLRPYKLQVAAGVLLLIIGSLVQVGMVFLIKSGIDTYIAQGDAAGLGLLAVTFAGAILVAFGAGYAELYIMTWLGQRVQDDIRMQIFRHIQKLHTGYFDRTPVGRIVTRLTNDVNALNEMFSSGVIAVIGDIFMLTLIVGALLYLNWQLALITFIVLPLLIGATMIFRAKVRDVYRIVRTKLAVLNAFTQEHITGMTIVQLFSREKRTHSQFDEINRGLRSAHFRSIYYYAMFFPTVEIIGSLSVALLLYFGGLKIYEGVLTFGGLVAFIQLVEKFYRPIRDLSEKYNILQASMASSERIFNLLDTKPDVKEIQVPKIIKNVKGKIQFENSWFAYNDEDWILKDISFSVNPGEKVAIVGSTGAGKTTLVSLLFRFYNLQRGAIKIDGVDIADMRLDDLRGLLGLVLQDVFLFTGDYAGNVRLRNKNITDEQVKLALERVGYSRFLKDEEDGIHTEVKERGATLSTGQKQLLSFARALAFDPQILILDEATSSVDTETEQLIQTALGKLLEGRTSIIIAHRLSTIEKADKIIVLHHGEIREIGKHQELLQKGGIYYKLYEMQYKSQLHRSELSRHSAQAAG
ncbi:MAG: ABC transporter ATP-binding protein [candidate division Zixibacteria bacterium]